MPIEVDLDNRIFHLCSRNASYVMTVTREGYLAHLYWGKRLTASSSLLRVLAPISRPFSPTSEHNSLWSLDLLPQEYPGFGHGDMRAPAYQVLLSDGTTVVDPRYRGYRIMAGKPALSALPHIRASSSEDAESLEMELEDVYSRLHIILSYTVLNKLDVVVRSVKFVNHSANPMRLLRALSVTVDFPEQPWEIISLPGAWGRERWVQRTSLGQGMVSQESRRGTSSHQANPFWAMVNPSTTEESGKVFAFNLVYSGNFLAFSDLDQYGQVRSGMGINPFDFSWHLEPEETFQTPEAVLVYSDQGLDHMSRTFHDLYREHLYQGPWKQRDRPILINNWEATYFSFTEEKLLDIALTASGLGIELFVLDDGWFGNRNNDRQALGDYDVNRDKLPHGLGALAEKVNQQGLDFGLWVEPEMVSPDSELYRRHPDWCLHVSGRSSSWGRNQLVLDLSRLDVQNWIIETLSKVFRRANISYVKWDMNRSLTETGSSALPRERQQETAHRYVLGLYHILDELTHLFPHVLFEGCSGGGGRFDPGILYYMPQIWTSDTTDAAERAKIQYGTSLVYPPVAMTAHVSQIPNHQVGRITPLAARHWIAMSANFGYELDLADLTSEEQIRVANYVRFYKSTLRKLVQWGEFSRLQDPFNTNGVSWMFSDREQNEMVVVYLCLKTESNPNRTWIKLRHLDSRSRYRVRGCTLKPEEEGAWEAIAGDELMNVGLGVWPRQDYFTQSWHLVREKGGEGGGF
ncbi:MAG: alpha-galactosidase [Firmicutes bacterium]|nr:alpha-galactosidase [Bacillota bacterium]